MAGTSNNWKGGKCIAGGLLGGCKGEGSVIAAKWLDSGYPVCSKECSNVVEAVVKDIPNLKEGVEKHALSTQELLNAQTKPTDAVQQNAELRLTYRKAIRTAQEVRSKHMHKAQLDQAKKMNQQFEEYGRLQERVELLTRTASLNREKHPQIAQSLDAAAAAHNTGLPMPPGLAVLKAGGHTATYKDNVKDAFNNAPGSKGVQEEVHHAALPGATAAYGAGWQPPFFALGMSHPPAAAPAAVLCLPAPPKQSVKRPRKSQGSQDSKSAQAGGKGAKDKKKPRTQQNSKDDNPSKRPKEEGSDGGDPEDDAENQVPQDTARTADAELSTEDGECKGKMLEGPWTADFERRMRRCGFITCPTNKLTPEGVCEVAAASKRAAIEMKAVYHGAPDPTASDEAWQSWLTSSQGLMTAGVIPVQFNSMNEDAQLSKLHYYWNTRASAGKQG